MFWTVTFPVSGLFNDFVEIWTPGMKIRRLEAFSDVRGPKRWLTLPFKNMDTESVAKRQKVLDRFLKVSSWRTFLGDALWILCFLLTHVSFLADMTGVA